MVLFFISPCTLHVTDLVHLLVTVFKLQVIGICLSSFCCGHVCCVHIHVLRPCLCQVGLNVEPPPYLDLDVTQHPSSASGMTSTPCLAPVVTPSLDVYLALYVNLLPSSAMALTGYVPTAVCLPSFDPSGSKESTARHLALVIGSTPP